MTSINTAKKDNPNSILRTARVSLGLKAKEAAAAIGVTKRTYLMWERGEMTPRADKTEKVAHVLQLPLESVPVGGKHAAYSKRPMKQYDPEKAARIEKYTPYRDRRLELGMTQAELAKKAGVNDNTISVMECGISEPLWTTRQKIRKALGWPEEHFYTVEERNEILLRLNNAIWWVLSLHREYLRDARVELEDAYQDLVLCAICAIDRYDPSGGAVVDNYVISQMIFEVRNIRTRALAKGFTGKDARRLSRGTLLSLDALTEEYERPSLRRVA